MQSKKRKKPVVLIIPRFEDIFHSFYAGEIIKGVSLAASRLQIDIVVHIVDRGDHRGWLDSSLTDHEYVGGIIFADIDNDIDVVKKAIRKGMPTIVLNNILEEPINWIAVDNYKAGFEVARQFVEMGHRRIAAIAGDLSTQAGEQRLAGFEEGLAAAGIKMPASHITYGNFLRTPAREAANKLLKLKEPPTAVFAASDVMALELIDVARKHNMRIPEEISVMGFDDNPLNSSSPVPLSTVYQPLVEMGRLGAEYLHQISRGQAKLPVKEMLTAKLVMRQSVATVSPA